MTTHATPRIGAHIALQPGHPHAGHTGTIIDTEQLSNEPPTATIQLDPPHTTQCAAQPHDWKTT